VNSADAFVFVMPEYGYGFSAPLQNAIDYLHHEWGYKPVGFVSYGGISGGTRAVQMIKQVVAMVRMMPLPEAVPIPFVRQCVGEDDQFRPNSVLETAADAMLQKLGRWTSAQRPLRAQPA
jgi:NAD(P)H-dependent FMN reductase